MQNDVESAEKGEVDDHEVRRPEWFERFKSNYTYSREINKHFKKIARFTFEVIRFDKALLRIANFLLERRYNVTRPPASGLIAILKALFTKRSFELYFAQTIADMHNEYFDALAGDRRWEARWRRIQIYLTISLVIVAWSGASIAKKFVEIWKVL